jgi:hypothetical protein
MASKQSVAVADETWQTATATRIAKIPDMIANTQQTLRTADAHNHFHFTSKPGSFCPLPAIISPPKRRLDQLISKELRPDAHPNCHRTLRRINRGTIRLRSVVISPQPPN